MQWIFIFIEKIQNFSGFISFLVLGEITDAIFKKVIPEKRNLVFYKLAERLKTIDIKSFNQETFKIALELTELDYNLNNEPADALHLAIAITNNANRFITLEDRKFNQTLRNNLKQRGLKIISLIPKLKP